MFMCRVNSMMAVMTPTTRTSRDQVFPANGLIADFASFRSLSRRLVKSSQFAAVGLSSSVRFALFVGRVVAGEREHAGDQRGKNQTDVHDVLLDTSHVAKRMPRTG